MTCLQRVVRCEAADRRWLLVSIQPVSPSTRRISPAACHRLAMARWRCPGSHVPCPAILPATLPSYAEPWAPDS
jgi:hypothetical protein